MNVYLCIQRLHIWDLNRTMLRKSYTIFTLSFKFVVITVKIFNSILFWLTWVDPVPLIGYLLISQVVLAIDIHIADVIIEAIKWHIRWQTDATHLFVRWCILIGSLCIFGAVFRGLLKILFDAKWCVKVDILLINVFVVALDPAYFLILWKLNLIQL